MRSRLTTAILLVVSFALACNPVYTTIDYDKDADFASYTTYSWTDIPMPDPQNANQASPIMIKHLRVQIENALATKGLTKVDSGGDLEVVYYFDAQQMLQIQQNNYSGLDMWADSRVGGHAKVDEITEGSLIVDLLDNATNQLLWRGIADNAHRSDAPPDQIRETIDRAVEKLFKEYPPK